MWEGRGEREVASHGKVWGEGEKLENKCTLIVLLLQPLSLPPPIIIIIRIIMTVLAVKQDQGTIRELHNGSAGSGLLGKQCCFVSPFVIMSMNIISALLLPCFQYCYLVYCDFRLCLCVFIVAFIDPALSPPDPHTRELAHCGLDYII